MKKTILIAILLVFLLSCSSKKEYFTKEIKDGITYIHNFKLPLSDIDLEPELIIGNEEKDTEIFSQISDIKEDNNRNIYIVDRKNNEIKVFSNEGKFVRIIGRKGEGPAEFNEPESIGFLNDKIFVSDTENRRFQLFDMKGNFIRTQKLEDDIPERFEISSDNQIHNKSIVFRFGNNQPENLLFRIYDLDFNKIGEFGSLRQFKEPFETFVMNISSFIIDSKNRVIVNFQVENKIQIFENNKLIKQIKRELFFKPTKPDIKTKGSDGSYNFSASYEPISYGLAIDTKDNIYVLTSYEIKSDEKEKEDEEYFSIILEIYNKDGILKQAIPIRGISPTKIYINKENKIYLIDSDEMKVIRYKAVL
ncbi:MAG: 6-bladed beta-propeller [Candidatus Cloacimonetes bacterium]|nr:6-bladed beta-propeller [Candidatus Cloacimonadota bacterium]